MEAGPDGASNDVGNPQQRLVGSGYVVYPEVTALGQVEAGALHCHDIPEVELGRAGLDEQGLHPESMQRTDQRRQTRCACSFLTSARYRGANGDDVDALDVRDTVGGVFALKPIHLVSAELARPSGSQQAPH